MVNFLALMMMWMWCLGAIVTGAMLGLVGTKAPKWMLMLVTFTWPVSVPFLMGLSSWVRRQDSDG